MTRGASESRIAILGWGSLLWDLDDLAAKVDGPWLRRAGPRLPMEFSRISPKRKMGLVLCLDPADGTGCATHAIRSRRQRSGGEPGRSRRAGARAAAPDRLGGCGRAGREPASGGDRRGGRLVPGGGLAGGGLDRSRAEFPRDHRGGLFGPGGQGRICAGSAPRACRRPCATSATRRRPPAPSCAGRSPSTPGGARCTAGSAPGLTSRRRIPRG